MDLTEIDAIGAILASLDANRPIPAITPQQASVAIITASPAVVVSHSPGLPIVPAGVGGTVVTQTFASPLMLRTNLTNDLLGSQRGGSMAFAKMTFYSRIVGGPSWTNTLWAQAVLGSPQQFLARANALGDAIASLTGAQTRMEKVRISIQNVPVTYPQPPRLSQLFTFSPAKAGSPGRPSAHPKLAMLIKLTPSNAVPPSRLYLHGFPDDFEVRGGNPAQAVADFFEGIWGAFVSTLRDRAAPTGNYGYVGQGTKIRGDIASVALNNGHLLITLVGAPFAAPFVANTPTIPIRFSGITKPSFLKGVHPCKVTSQSTLLTAKPFAFNTYEGNGTITYNGGGAFQLINFVTCDSIVEHDVGHPLDPQRGRRPNRPTV